MAKGLQSSFTSGELTPALHRRPDLEKYITGLKKCYNMIVHPHGGVSNRAGNEFIVEVKDSTKSTRVLPFSFNTTDNYVLEWGDQYLRVVRQGGQVVLSVTPAAWVVTTAYVVTDHVSISGVNYYCFNAHTSATADEPGVGANWQLYWHQLTDDIVEIPTPFLEDELFVVKILQSADIITICHPNHPQSELARTAHDKWTLSDITFQPTILAPTSLTASGGAGATFNYVVTAISEELAEESLPSVLVTNLEDGGKIIWTDAIDAESYAIYKEKNGVYGFVGVSQSGVDGFTDEKFIPEYDDTPPLSRDHFTGAGNYPSVAAYHEQRLVFANSLNKPQQLWFSQTGNFHNFNVSSPAKDDDAITLRIDAAQVNAVRNLVSLEDFIVMTSGAVHKITSGDNTFAFTNLRTKPQSYRGSSGIDAVVIDNTILFVQARGSRIRDVAYELSTDGYKGKSLSILSEHLVKGKTIVDWAYAQEPDSIIWIVLSDGKLLGVTYLVEQDVLAWHQHETDGLYESMCTVSESNEDAVYYVVNRTINGVTKRFIERMHTRQFAKVEDAFFVDSGLSYTGTTATVISATKTNPVIIGATGHNFANGETIVHEDVLGMVEINGPEYTVANVTANTYELQGIDGTNFTTYISGGVAKKLVTTLSGLDHLEGEKVAILADGNVHSQQTVVSGAISISYGANKIHIGLPYTAEIETLEPPFEGTAGSPKQAAEIIVGVLDSRGLWAGPINEPDMLVELKQRNNENWGEATRLATGYFNIAVESTWEHNGQLLLRQVDPLPLTILSVVPDYDVGS